jgi:hypothetical protein
VTSSYIPSANADLINLLYLQNNYYTRTNIDTTFTSYYTKTSTDTLLNAKANLSGATFTGTIDMGANKITTTYAPVNTSDLTNKNYVDTRDALKLSLTGTTTDLDMNAKNISNVNTISGTLLNTKNGNTNVGTTNNQLTLEYSGGGYKHAIKSRHNSTADDTGNAIDFYIWKVADTQNVIGTKQLMSITSVGVGIFKNNPSYALDVVGTCNISGNTTLGGTLDTGSNKITSSAVPSANSDIVNLLYLNTNHYNKTTTDSNISTAITNLKGAINTWTAGNIFNVGLTANGNIDAGSNRIICNLSPANNNDCTNKLYVDNMYATIPTYYYTKTQIDANIYTQAQTNTLFNAKASLSGATFTGGVSIPDLTVSGTLYNSRIRAGDNRLMKPSDQSAGTISFNFGDFNNNGGSSFIWSDCIHLNSYVDGSGGNSNVLMLRKDGNVGMRVYTGGFGSTTAYTTYKDALLIDSSNNINFNTLLTSSALNINTSNTQNTTIGNTTGTLTLNNPYMPTVALASALNRQFLTVNPSGGKIEFQNYGWGFTKIFELNCGAVANWGAGTLSTGAFITTRTGGSQQVLFSGHVSGYSQIANNLVTIKLRFNLNGTTTYTYEDIKFYINASYTHVVFPINLVRTFAFGLYDVYIYVPSGSSFITDIGDFVFLNSTVIF